MQTVSGHYDISLYNLCEANFFFKKIFLSHLLANFHEFAQLNRKLWAIYPVIVYLDIIFREPIRNVKSDVTIELILWKKSSFTQNTVKNHVTKYILPAAVFGAGVLQ